MESLMQYLTIEVQALKALNCNECAKAIIQSGIKTIIYEDDKYKDSAVVRASKRMLNAAKVRYYEYQPGNRVLKINV